VELERALCGGSGVEGSDMGPHSDSVRGSSGVSGRAMV
jgi:hypothetical protein